MAVQHNDERRRAPRIPVLVRVECRTPQNYVLGNCENINETGMLVMARQTFEVSQAVTLRFALPPISTGKVIQTGGVIVRAEAGKYMAVEFAGLRPPFRDAIARYIEQRRVVPPPPIVC